MTPTLLDLALKAGFSEPIEGWMGEAYEERLEAFAKLIIEHEAEKQEPVALETVYETIIDWDEGGGKRSRRELARRIVALYTTPQPQREWVGLTDEEMQQACYETFSYDPYVIARAIEQALKEKNGESSAA